MKKGFLTVVGVILVLNCSFEVAYSTEEPYCETSVDLNPIVVSAKRVEEGKTTDFFAEETVVYTKEYIEKTPARDLGEVLNYIPGVDVAVRSKFGQATSITMHGAESRHVLIMVDDIPFNTQLSGQVNPSKIPLSNVERIEIIKGASSSTWGSSLGGVINVITKDVGDTEVPHGSFSSSFAEFATRKQMMDLAGKIGDTGYLLTGSYLRSDGIRSESGVKEKKAFVKLAHPLGDQVKLTGSFGYSGANVWDGVLSNNRNNNTPYVSRYGKVKLDFDKPGLDFSAAFKYNDQDITTDIFNGTTKAQIFSTVSRNVFNGVSLNGCYYVRGIDMLVFGADFEWHTIKSNNYLDTSKDISMQAPYANYTWEKDNWSLIPGVRFDNNDQFGSQVSPSLGAVYHFNKKTSVRFKISRAFNAPPLLWIFNDDPGLLVGANPDLKAERSLVLESGIKTKIARVGIDLSWYFADVKDALATVFRSDLGVFRKENFRKFRRQGAELALRYKVCDGFEVYTSGAFNHVVNRTTGQIVRGNGTARQSFRWGVNYNNKKGFDVNLYGHYDRWDAAVSQEPNDRKPIFDISFKQEVKKAYKDTDTELFLNIYNITNSKYWENILYPLPKRYFEGGITVKF